MDINRLSGVGLVPIALGKYLFSFRTQKSSLVAAIILRKWESSKVPNYRETIRKDGFLSAVHKIDGRGR